jgi:UDP-glucuronate 4-epimerase
VNRVLLSGAAGFIGSHVAEGLVSRGDDVVGLDNFDAFYPRAIKEANLAALRRSPRFQLVEGDIRNRDLVAGLVKGCGAVVHLAARAGVRPSLEDPALYASVNVEGTATLLEAARRSGVRRFVFGSSSSVYGDTAPVPFSEQWPALDPISPYAATKRAGELLCATFAGLYGLRAIALRLFTVYGPRQRPDLAIHKFTRLITEGRPVPVYGDGSSERDYTYISDIVAGVLAALDWTDRAGGAGALEIVNLGESRTTRLDALVGLISRTLGREARLDRLPAQPGDVRRTCADVRKATHLLGYRPATTVEEGVPRFVRWYEEVHGRQG